MATSELIIRDSRIYHLDLIPGEVAGKILLVGDPDRVTIGEQFLENITTKREHREFRTVTGKFGGVDVSIISTGIGTDNIDIVLTELDALFNIDFTSGVVHKKPVQLEILRAGTCGTLAHEVSPGSLIISHSAIGGDGLMGWYQDDSQANTVLAADFRKFILENYPNNTVPEFYAYDADSGLISIAQSLIPELFVGITYTASGFYGPQGRNLGRIPLRYTDWLEKISRYTYSGHGILNFEMETSAILGLSSCLGHKAGSLSLVLANRKMGTFLEETEQGIQKLMESSLRILTTNNAN
jgi:uridine phosphorylase